MTEAGWIAIMSGLPATIAAIGAIIIALMNRKQMTVVSGQVEQVHKATNGMKAELIESARASSLASGIAQGVNEERARLGAMVSSAIPIVAPIVAPVVAPIVAPVVAPDPLAQQRAIWIAEGIRQERARAAGQPPPREIPS